MIRYLLLCMLLVTSAASFAQLKGSINGQVTDEETGETLIGVNIEVFQGGARLSQGASTDLDGNYSIGPLDGGTYDLVFSYVGYPDTRLNGVRLNAGQTLTLNQKLSAGTTLEEAVVIDYKVPLVQMGGHVGGQTLTAEDMENRPTLDLNTITASTARVAQTDEGRETFSAGARSDANDVYIDGIRVRGNAGLSILEVEQAQVIVGGVPAAFGDATGSITNFITKAPKAKFGGYVQVESSQLTDPYQTNRIDLGINGPIWTKPMLDKNGKELTESNGKVKRETVIGFRLFGTGYTSLDASPSAVQLVKLKDSKLEDLRQNPMTIYNGNLFNSASYVDANSYEMTNVRPNNRDYYYQFGGNLYFKINKQMSFKASGQYYNSRNMQPFDTYRLFNADRNPAANSNNWRVGGTFEHIIPNANKQEGIVVENANYSLHADYTQVNSSIEDMLHGNNFFNYGYVGQFQEKLTAVPSAEVIFDDRNNPIDTIYTTGYFRDFIDYTANTEINPQMARYNLLVGDVYNNPQRGDYIAQNGLFGTIGSSVFGLHTNAGAVYNTFQKVQANQIGVRISGGFDIANKKKSSGNGESSINRHKLSFGIVYEQREDRGYTISPSGLWQIADLRANSHISVDSADRTRIIANQMIPCDGCATDSIVGPVYAPFVDMNNITGFATNLRNSLGVDQREWVNVLGLNPSQLNFNMFAPDDVLTQQDLIMDYYGYDFYGNPVGNNVTFKDFFTDKDVNTGKYTRKVAPFSPIYTAVYLEDAFQYKGMNFRLGLRLDRYDANTKVLKDPYLLFGTKTVADVRTGGVNVPSTVPSDAYVYRSDVDPSSSIIGYRQGDQWYDADGASVNNSTVIAQNSESGIPVPDFINANVTDIKSPDFDPNGTFKDFDPRLIFMPRLAFSFPIGEKAEFFAHYDILSRRPSVAEGYASALDYFNFLQKANNGDLFGNPGLLPQQTVDYEVGYQQQIGKSSSVKFSVFYREFRNLIQARKYFYTYPVNSYESFANNDYATVKGLTVEYDLRRVGNVRMLANYTLQFADGTGSNSTSNRSITSVVNPFIRQTFPLAYDIRHQLYLNVDYRFGKGKGKIGKWPIFENAGANLEFNLNSGTPFTRKAIATQFGGEQTVGTLNGSRLPWNYRFDLRIDKDFTFGKKDGKQTTLNVYFRIQNLLNTANILGVYPATADPDDDGFLRDLNGVGPTRVSNFDREYGSNNAYVDLYNVAMISPGNYSLPRRFFIGLRFEF